MNGAFETPYSYYYLGSLANGGQAFLAKPQENGADESETRRAVQKIPLAQKV
jgi:hypothetical protein